MRRNGSPIPGYTPQGTFNVYERRRVGRPRGHWAEYTMRLALEKLEGEKFDRNNINHFKQQKEKQRRR